MPKKPGPKTEVNAELERTTLTLDSMTRRRLRVLGLDRDGRPNESRGVRIAARVAYQQYQKTEAATRRAPWPAMDRATLVTWLLDSSADDPTHPAAQAAQLLKEQT